MLFAITIGRVTFELTRSDVLLKAGKRELYWSWTMDVGPVSEKRG